MNFTCNCGARFSYHELYDAYFCSECNVWKEKACTDPNCSFCKNRPENPLDETLEDREIKRYREAYLYWIRRKMMLEAIPELNSE